MSKSFAHLHLHTEYSMLDGAARIPDVIAAAAADGQPAVGITDHGNMYGVLDFYRAAREAGLNPVVGTEAYMTADSRFDRPRRSEHEIYHLTLLAETNEGYRNLIKVSSHAYLDGYFYKPRVDFDLLEQHAAGLIATSGCLGGLVSQQLEKGDEAGARESAARFQSIFGRDSFFIELQDHGLPEQKRVNPQLVKIAADLGAPLLATNDSHYTKHEHAEAHDALLCVQTGATRDDPNRFKLGNGAEEFWVKPAAMMRELFQDYPEACDSTLLVAERANVEIEFGKPELPEFPTPEGHDEKSYLRELTYKGAAERYGEQLPPHVRDRIEFELGVIEDMGFSAYFLVVWDLVKYARDQKIRVGPGRGSAAGSCVAFCLRIVDIDPIKYDLVFERFLNPGRKQMPDIDMDFDERRRSDVIRYAAQRYGSDHVAQIVTFSTIKARAAVRDASRVLGYQWSVGDKIAKLMPPLIMGRDTSLKACLESVEGQEDGYKMAAELRSLYETDPDAKRVVDVARGLEGLRRQDGIHAAAVVITRRPLTEYLPIQRKPEPGVPAEQAPMVTQYEMHGVEDLGLLKMDFLGLRNLSVIERTLELVEATTGQRVDIDNVPLDDAKTFEMLRSGESIGVFQLEGGPMRSLMRSLAPNTFDDIAALVALYRPGPMAANMHTDYADRKNGRKPVSYYHESLVEILEPTYGLCLTGDTVVYDATTGHPRRLDSVDPSAGFAVQGVDEGLRPAVRSVTHWVCNGEKETVELRLTNGMALTGTSDHRVLTDRGWIEIGDLTEDDYVGVPHELVTPPAAERYDPDRLRVLGYLIGDGTLSQGATANFTNRDDDLVNAYRYSLSAAFPTVRHSVSKRSSGINVVYTGNGRGNGGHASSLIQWLRELGLKTPAGSSTGGPKSAEKFAPEFVFGLDDVSIGQFLAALWDCDGHVCERFAHYKTVSSRLAKQVQHLLLRLGIASTIYEGTLDRERNPGGSERSYQVTIFDGAAFTDRVQRFMASDRKWRIQFAAESKGTSIDRRLFVTELREHVKVPTRELGDRYGLPRWNVMPYGIEYHPRIHAGTMTRLLEHVELPEVERLLNVQWVRVQDVRPAGHQLVYDITVDGIHNFVANGMVVHNCIFQEQLMRIAQVLAGYTLEEADNLRKATGKKIRSLIAQERSKFVDGCVTTGHTRQFGEQMFDIIEPFADYSFNKSHSVGYGYVAYQTAYLKANHSVEYFAALLTSVKANKDQTAVYLSECRRMGIPVLVPDVNESESDFAVRDGSIRFGLSAVRNVGEGIVVHFVAAREEGGPFTDFFDFCERVDPAALNKRTVESLIKAGAFDSLGHPRQGLLQVHEAIVDSTLARRREREAGIMSLFGEGPATNGAGDGWDERAEIPDTEFKKAQRLAFEKEMLGLYVSEHPMMSAERSLRRHIECTLADLKECHEGEIRVVGGIVSALNRRYTKRGDLMATFVLEDLGAALEVMVFPKTMTGFGHLLVEDAIVCVKGRLDLRDDQPKIIAVEITVPDLVLEGGPPVRLKVRPDALSNDRVEQLKALLREHPGDSPVYVHLERPERTTVLQLDDEYLVDSSNGLYAELRILFGADCIA